MTGSRAPVTERIMRRILVADGGCWLWLGSKTPAGYARININGRIALAHRVMFETSNGAIPESMEIDHICHNKSCVNPSHLRLADHGQNNRYQKTRKNNTSGFKGVCFDRARCKWMAKIRLNYTQINLGRFDTPEEAFEAYCRASEKYHGDFSCTV